MKGRFQGLSEHSGSDRERDVVHRCVVVLRSSGNEGVDSPTRFAMGVVECVQYMTVHINVCFQQVPDLFSSGLALLRLFTGDVEGLYRAVMVQL